MTLRVTPSELRSGASKLDAEKAVIAGIVVPDETAAKAGLEGFETAGKLSAANDAVKSALKIVGDATKSWRICFATRATRTSCQT